MIVGFDLDGTYAADLTTFRGIAGLLKDAGHSCVMVTNRCEQDRAAVEELIDHEMPVLFSCGKPKRQVAEEAGYFVQIWIDDNPSLVDFGEKGLQMVGLYDKGRKWEG